MRGFLAAAVIALVTVGCGTKASDAAGGSTGGGSGSTGGGAGSSAGTSSGSAGGTGNATVGTSGNGTGSGGASSTGSDTGTASGSAGTSGGIMCPDNPHWDDACLANGGWCAPGTNWQGCGGYGLFDENGCMRQQCKDTSECAAGEVCFDAYACLGECLPDKFSCAAPGGSCACLIGEVDRPNCQFPTPEDMIHWCIPEAENPC